MITFDLKLSLFIVIFTIISCQDGKQSITGISENKVDKIIPLIEFTTPFNGDNYSLGEVIIISLKPSLDSIVIDSVKIFINGSFESKLKANNLKYIWDTKNARLGLTKIEVQAYSSKGLTYKTFVNINLISKINPKNYSYTIINTFPHSRDAYTQGLIYENGFFYESDGLYNKSALRKVKPETGEAVNYAILEPKIFAEGIAVYNEKIYQISWREKTCFVYDKKTFRLDRQLKYDIDEGWGLTYDGKNFIMTDGSNTLYYIEPISFTEVNRIEVMDNIGPVNYLNELEYIDGKLYANIYQTNYIIIINPKTGEVTGKIDFSGLLSKTDYRENTDVLNGIAYNPDNGHLFVTGKNWPKLFEVSLNELRK
jgi:glutaminyl-peptide cyclotransferase